MSSGSVVTISGTISSMPMLDTLPSGAPVMWATLSARNPSGWASSVRLVAYGSLAQNLSLILVKDSYVWITGHFQTRSTRLRVVTEIVIESLTPIYGINWSNEKRDRRQKPSVSLRPFGAQAMLLGEVINNPDEWSFKAGKHRGIVFEVKVENPQMPQHPANIKIAYTQSDQGQYREHLKSGMLVTIQGEVCSVRERANGEYGLFLYVFPRTIEIVAEKAPAANSISSLLSLRPLA